MAEKILTSELVIKASDQSGQVFEKVGAKIDKLAAAGRRIGGMSSQFQTLGNHVNGTAQKLDLLHSKMSRIESAGKSLSKVLGPLSGTMSAIAAFEVAKLTGEAARETVKATAQGAHERVRMETAGMKPEEIASAEAASARLTGEFKPLSQTTILHLLRNARSIVGSYEEAEKLMEPLLRTYIVAMGAHPDKKADLEEQFDKLTKSQEILGVTQDMPRFVKDMDLMAKALNVFGDTLKPEEFFNFAKYARQAGPGFSDEFLMSVAPTLMQEMGGQSAGEVFSSFYSQFVSGKMPLQTARLMQQYGLIDPHKIEFTKAGLLKTLKPGAVKGYDLARENPYRWVNEVLLPTLKAKGASKKEVDDVLSVLGSKRTTAQVMGILATQQSRINKDIGLQAGAMGHEAAGLFMSKDPYIAMAAVSEQFTNLLQAAGGPLAQPAADALNALARGLNALYEAAGKHPEIASGALIGVGGAVATGAVAGGLWGVGKAVRYIRNAPATPSAVGALEANPWAGLETAAATAPRFLSMMARVMPYALVPAALYELHEATKEYAGMTPAERTKLQRGGLSVGELRRNAYDERDQRFGIDSTVEIKLNTPLFEAEVRSIVRDEQGRPSSGTTGSLGKSMQEAGPGPY